MRYIIKHIFLNSTAMMRNNYQQSQDSITKISRSKSRNQVVIATKLKKEKEIKWNERFHLDQIPEYNYNNQPHSQYLKNKFRIPNRKNQNSKAKRFPEPSLEKNKVSNKPNPRMNEEKVKEAITKAFNDLKVLWYEKKIPQCHMEALTKIFNRQNNPTKIFEDIKQQYSDISKQTSQIQKIVSAIATRQNCLQKIDQIILTFESQEKSKLFKQFQEKIAHLRILTIHCIECIFQWKQTLQSMNHRLKVRYMYNGQLYANKLNQDYYKIINSEFKDIYKFEQNKVDAFFLNFSYEGKKVSNVSKNLVKRIRLCEIMLNKDDQNSQPEVKRSPMIEKSKQPPRNDRERSVPSRGKTPLIVPWTKVPVQYGQFNDYIANMLSKSGYKDSFLPTFQLSKYEEYTIYRFSETEQQVVLGVDKNASQRKIILFAIKSFPDTIENFIKSCCEHLWENDFCSQIRLPLLHSRQRQNYTVDLDLEKKIKGVGFRWASVNQSGQTRTTIFGLKRPLNVVAHKTARRVQSYPVVIEHLTTLSMIERKQKKHPNKCFASVLDLIQKVSQLNQDYYQQICQRDQFSHHLECIKRSKEFLEKQAIRDNCEPQPIFSYPGMRSFNAQNQETLDKIFSNIQIPVKHAKAPSILSLLNTSFKYRHVTIQDGKYTKFFPHKDSQILICESNYPIYLLQTDEQNINFFVIEVAEGFSMSSIENIFNSMGQQSSFIDQFWLPTFYKSEEYTDEVGFPSTEIISTNYRNSLGSLTRKSKVRTKIIKAPFVFGMINKRLLEMLEIPFYCTLVGKQDLV